MVSTNRQLKVTSHFQLSDAKQALTQRIITTLVDVHLSEAK